MDAPRRHSPSTENSAQPIPTSCSHPSLTHPLPDPPRDAPLHLQLFLRANPSFRREGEAPLGCAGPPRPCRAPRVQQTAPAGLCPCQLHPLLICYGKSSGKSVELFKSPAPVPCEQYPFHICRMIKSLVTSLLLESSSRSIINPCSQPARGLRALLFQDLKIYLSSLTALISSCRDQQCLNRNL